MHCRYGVLRALPGHWAQWRGQISDGPGGTARAPGSDSEPFLSPQLQSDRSPLKYNSVPTSQITVQVPVGIERADVFVDTPTEVHGSPGVVLSCRSQHKSRLSHQIEEWTPQAISDRYLFWAFRLLS